jgi:hypothetical protein
MTDIGDVSHIANFIPEVQKVSEHDIKAHEGPAISQVHIIVNGWTTHIHTDPVIEDGLEQFLLSGKCIKDI